MSHSSILKIGITIIVRDNMYIIKNIFAFIVVLPISATLLDPFSKDSHITDVSQTIRTPVSNIVKPSSITELQRIVVTSNKPLSIAGGRFSQGGHIAYPGGIVIDMTKLNKIISFDKKSITVEAGATWRDIQRYIAPYNRAVRVMQSYNDFTVGGSLSVNVHGRDIHYGPLIETVNSIELLLSDGRLVTASRCENSDLFAGAIGGYGALGIITQATLSLTRNSKITCRIKQMPIEQYPTYFKKKILTDPKVVLHNGNLYPNDCTQVGSITWYETDKPLTDYAELREANKYYPGHMVTEQLLRRFPLLKSFRPPLEKRVLKNSSVVLRNYEMSGTVNTLEPLVRFPTTMVLQEYFIPCAKLIPYVNRVRSLIEQYHINVLNISIRYVPENTESVLSYAKQESFALVFYINMFNTDSGLEKAQAYTRKLIQAALEMGGTYYLPYQLFGTKRQLTRAYPRLLEFINLKKQYDPQNRFRNNFLKKYQIADS